LYLRIIIGDVSSVGSERMLHTHEVAGSNPARPTNNTEYQYYYYLLSIFCPHKTSKKNTTINFSCPSNNKS
jgi:hypothetical protein